MKEKIKELIQESNTRLDYYNQEIGLIIDQPNKKALLHTYYENKRIEQAKIKVLKRLLQ